MSAGCDDLWVVRIGCWASVKLSMLLLDTVVVGRGVDLMVQELTLCDDIGGEV